MNLDDTVCHCFHVSLRRVLAFLRIERPRVASQLSKCDGAGTGCGWCRPLLERCFTESTGVRGENPLAERDGAEDAERRETHRGRK